MGIGERLLRLLFGVEEAEYSAQDPPGFECVRCESTYRDPVSTCRECSGDVVHVDA